MKRALISIITAAMMMAALTGCSKTAASPENVQTTDAKVEIPEFTLAIEGVDGVTKFTSEDAAKLTLSELETSVTNKNGETTVSTYSGVLLKDLLEAIGVKDLKQLTIEASDGYQVVYDKNMAFADDVIVGFLKDGQPLENHAVNISPAKASGKTLAKMAAKLIVE